MSEIIKTEIELAIQKIQSYGQKKPSKELAFSHMLLKYYLVLITTINS